MSRQESQHEVEEREPKRGAKGPRHPRPFGISYEYRTLILGRHTRWYRSERGRNQALAKMRRDGFYKPSLEKCER